MRPMAKSLPDSRGYFGAFGGRFVPETLMAALDDLAQAYQKARHDKAFQQEFGTALKEFAGRPTPLFFAERLTERFARPGGRGPTIYLKREDLCHTGAHKINNCLGQILLARRMGKTRIIAETGAGQHGVATATVAALYGMPCVVYMGEEDTQRQALNVYRMKHLGAEVRPVKTGSRTLKDAINEALRDWITNVHDSFYIIGSCVGPHPYPLIVRDFQSVIGKEARVQILKAEGRLPTHLMACVGGGSNAIGLFYPFVNDRNVKMIGVEAGGRGSSLGQHAATLVYGKPGILHGTLTYLLQTKEGQIASTHSVSAGLDYPGVGPEHGYLKDSKRATYVSVNDREALDAFQMLAKLEGIVPALEPSHALAYLKKLAPKLSKRDLVIVGLSGRGDKDVETVAFL